MPIYEYRCAACGHQEEFLQKVTERPLLKCPKCGKSKFQKMLSAAGFQLKGSGWYATDFKPAARNTEVKAGDSKPEAKTESKTETKPESKPDAKKAPKTEAAA